MASLASVTRQDGTLYVLCFSDDEPETGPHPVTTDELKESFGSGSGWRLAAVEADRIQTRFQGDHGAPAWCATVKRV